jgi:hypothetical protein
MLLQVAVEKLIGKEPQVYGFQYIGGAKSIKPLRLLHTMKFICKTSRTS